MIYGNVFLPKKEVSASILEFGIQSVVYDEYCVYNSLLESCTDDTNKSILEAQVTILREVSFKDIIDKIIKKITSFLEWLKDLVTKIVEKVKSFFNNKKYKSVIEALRMVGKGKRVNIESHVLEYSKDLSSNNDLMNIGAFSDDFFFKYEWLFNGLSVRFKSKDFVDKYQDTIEKSSEKIHIEMIKCLNDLSNNRDDADKNINELVEKMKKHEEIIESTTNKLEYVNIINDIEFDEIGKANNNGDLFKDPEKYRLLCAKFAEYLADECEILGKQMPAMEKLIKEYKHERDTGYDRIRKEIEKYTNKNSNVSYDMVAKLVGSSLSLYSSLASSYSIAFNKLLQAQEKMYSRGYKLLLFFSKYNNKLGYLDSDFVLIKGGLKQ